MSKYLVKMQIIIHITENKSCICYGQQVGMGQTYSISAGAHEIDRKCDDTYKLMCRQESI